MTFLTLLEVMSKWAKLDGSFVKFPLMNMYSIESPKLYRLVLLVRAVIPI